MNLIRQSNGNVMIELALILPILIMLLLGVFDIGLVLEEEIAVADSARAGAEYATTSTTAADTVGMQRTAVNSAGSIPGYQVSAAVFCTCGPGGSSVSCSGTCSSGSMPSQYAQVTATASLPLVFKLAGLTGSIPMQSVVRTRTVWTGGK